MINNSLQGFIKYKFSPILVAIIKHKPVYLKQLNWV